MKGPYERLKYDLRRLWECPVCGHKERTSGAVTSRFCRCQQKEKLTQQKPMRLVEDHIRRVGKPPAPKEPLESEGAPAPTDTFT